MTGVCIEIIQWGVGDRCNRKERWILSINGFFKKDFLKYSSYKNTLYIWSKSYDQQAAENLCLLLIMDATEQKFPLQGFTRE